MGGGGGGDVSTGNAGGNAACENIWAMDVKDRSQSSSPSINSFGSTIAHGEESLLSKDLTADVSVVSADGDGDDMVDDE